MFPLGKFLTSMPKSVFDGKLKKGRKINLKIESTIPEKYISMNSLLMDKHGKKSPFLTSRYQHGAFAEMFNRSLSNPDACVGVPLSVLFPQSV